METKNVAIVLVDISGYTEFTQAHSKTSPIHAEEIITELLEIVIDKAKYPLTLNKLEGDALLLYAELNDHSKAQAIQSIFNQVNTFFGVFHSKLNGLKQARAICPCEACQGINKLQLKVVLHGGDVVFKKMRQFEELAGEAMIVTHRLLKNSVKSNEYILTTDTVALMLDDKGEQYEENYPDLGKFNVNVFYPKIPTENDLPPVAQSNIALVCDIAQKGMMTTFNKNMPLILQWDLIAPLLLRLYLAPIFWMAGMHKFNAFSDTVEWFGNAEWGLGLPFPFLLTMFVTVTELAGAIFLLLGFGVRFISIPLILTMIGAALSVHWQNGWLAIAEGEDSFFASERTIAAIERLNKAKDILKTHGNYEYLTEFGNFAILNNGIEFAATYTIMLIALLFLGAGRYVSVDFWLKEKVFK